MVGASEASVGDVCERSELRLGGGDGERSERGGVGERSERRGGPASEASLPPEASQVVAEGDGLRVFNIQPEITDEYRFHLEITQ